MANPSLQRVVYSILEFLERQRSELSDVDEERAESIEVTLQCLESVYGVSLENLKTDAALASRIVPLERLYGSESPLTVPVAAKKELTQADKDKAEQYKTQGNELMKQEKFQEALVCYTQAIDIDDSNAVYFCNRAAAYSKLQQHEHALNDCSRAIELDPKYSKAYGRKGLAHSAVNQHAQAKECYQMAMELDPANQSYKQNLEIAEQKLREMPPMSGMPGGMPGMGGLNLGGMDFSSLLSNPALMNMATNMLQNPQMQEMMAGMMSGGQGGAGGEMGPDGLSGLLQAGQQLAQQMQQSNPELVSQLRNQMRDDQDPNNPDGAPGQ